MYATTVMYEDLYHQGRFNWEWLMEQPAPLAVLDDFALEKPDALRNNDAFELELVATSVDETRRQLAIFTLAVQMYNSGWIKDEYAKSARQLDLDPTSLLQATTITRRVGTAAVASETVANYQLIEYVNSLDKIPIDIKAFARKPETFDRSAASYKLIPVVTDDYQGEGYVFIQQEQRPGHPDQLASVYMDAPVGLQLVYDGLIQAVAGIVVSDNALLIRQIQGVSEMIINGSVPTVRRYHPRGLERLHWSAVLVAGCEQVAKDLGIQQVAVLSVQNSNWQEVRESQRAPMIYDGTAEGMGYSRSNDGNWHKVL